MSTWWDITSDDMEIEDGVLRFKVGYDDAGSHWVEIKIKDIFKKLEELCVPKQ